MLETSRLKWVDIAKGIGIIFIVLGHAGNPTISKYLFWFHVPLFFMLSGYVFKPLNRLSDLPLWIKKRAKKLLLTYFTYLLVFYLILIVQYFINGELTLALLIKRAITSLFGGRALSYLMSPMWFITTLLLTQVLFAYISLKCKKQHVFLIIGIFYLLAHLESLLAQHMAIYIPFNADVVLLALTFYAIGYYLKDILSDLTTHKKMVLSAIAFGMIAFLLDIRGVINYYLDLNMLVYNNLILDLVLPISFSLMVCFFCQLLEKISLITEILSSIGKSSLTILYLHIPVNVIMTYFIDLNFVFFTIIGVLVPYSISIILKRNQKTSKQLLAG